MRGKGPVLARRCTEKAPEDCITATAARSADVRDMASEGTLAGDGAILGAQGMLTSTTGPSLLERIGGLIPIESHTAQGLRETATRQDHHRNYA